VKDIILEASAADAIVLNVDDLMTYLNRLTDTQDRRGKICLGLALTLVIPAKLSGEDKPSGIAEWK